MKRRSVVFSVFAVVVTVLSVTAAPARAVSSPIDWSSRFDDLDRVLALVSGTVRGINSTLSSVNTKVSSLSSSVSQAQRQAALAKVEASKAYEHIVAAENKLAAVEREIRAVKNNDSANRDRILEAIARVEGPSGLNGAVVDALNSIKGSSQAQTKHLKDLLENWTAKDCIKPKRREDWWTSIQDRPVDWNCGVRRGDVGEAADAVREAVERLHEGTVAGQARQLEEDTKRAQELMRRSDEAIDRLREAVERADQANRERLDRIARAEEQGQGPGPGSAPHPGEADTGFNPSSRPSLGKIAGWRGSLQKCFPSIAHGQPACPSFKFGFGGLEFDAFAGCSPSVISTVRPWIQLAGALLIVGSAVLGLRWVLSSLSLNIGGKDV